VHESDCISVTNAPYQDDIYNIATLATPAHVGLRPVGARQALPGLYLPSFAGSGWDPVPETTPASSGAD